MKQPRPSFRAFALVASGAFVLAACSDMHSTTTPDAARDALADSSLAPDGAAFDGAVNTDASAPDASGDAALAPPDSSPPFATTVCPGDALASFDDGAACHIEGTGAALLVTADVLLPNGELKGGQVLVDDTGHIVCAACDCSALPAASTATRITCPDGVLSPGLINAHDHLTYAQDPPYSQTPERYEQRHDWRRGQRGHNDIPSQGSATSDQMRWGELRFVMGGATSVNGSGGVLGFLRNLDTTTMNESLPVGRVVYDTFPLNDSNGTQLLHGCAYNTMPGGGIATTASIAMDNAYTPHVSEGIDRAARNEFQCVRTGSTDLVQPQSAFIHGVALLPPDIAEMAHDGTSLVWSPRSNVTLYGDTARVTEMVREGVNVALGTDWMPSGSMNVLRELHCADNLNANYYDHFFADVDLWRMVTVNAARALHVDAQIGSVATGLLGDLAIFDSHTHRDHRAVIDAQAGDVVLVMRAGRVVYGDDALVSGTTDGAMCDPIDVCGHAKRACVSRETSGMRTLAALQTANSSRYPLFFCGEPDNEPSCLPMRNAVAPYPPSSIERSTVYTGASNATDRDGDGIEDAMDLCPTVFDPIRPVDQGRLADFDGDGVGDACDPCPLDANAPVCHVWNPADRDSDGVTDSADNCPDRANPLQTDTDRDLTGDACDRCAMEANANDGACTVTVTDVKRSRVAVGDKVNIADLLVTAIGHTGFWVQTDPASAGYTGAQYTGVFVYTGTSAITVAVGDRVSLANATVQNFHSEYQLSGATVTASAHGVTVPVEDVEAATVFGLSAPEGYAYEGVLVRVQGVGVTDRMPAQVPATVTGQFLVTGGLRIDASLYAVTPVPAVGEVFGAITGVLVRYENTLLLTPRTMADVVSGGPVLAAFPSATVFVRVGNPSATIPSPALAVSIARAVATDTTVALSSSDTDSLVPLDAMVTIPAGMTSVALRLDARMPTAAPVMLRAQIVGTTVVRTAMVRVIAANAAPAVSAVTGASTVRVNTDVTLTVSLDVPAPAAGASVMLTADNGATVPASVTVAADATSATFTLHTPATVPATAVTVTATLAASSATAMVNVTATGPGHLVINEIDYDQPTSDTMEFVELYNAGNSPVDLSTVSLAFVNGSGTTPAQYTVVITPALSGTLAPGAYAVVANSAVTVPAGVLRFAIADSSIQNGDPDGVALVDRANMRVIDALSYGGAITSVRLTGFTAAVSLVEGTATTVRDTGVGTQSLARVPDGTDTDNASHDWVLSTHPTPGAANTM